MKKLVKSFLPRVIHALLLIQRIIPQECGLAPRIDRFIFFLGQPCDRILNYLPYEHILIRTYSTELFEVYVVNVYMIYEISWSISHSFKYNSSNHPYSSIHSSNIILFS